MPPLPEMYSPELNQVIRDCLRVNPDRRPDTAQLLNLPVVKLMRKEKEVVDLNKLLRAREDGIKKKERELEERLARLDRERNAVREELDASLRREWEVKARLEIDRLANAEVERLQKRFDDEVRARIEAEMAKGRANISLSGLATAPVPAQTSAESRSQEEYSSSVARSDFPYSSVGASGDEFASTTDITEYSLDSPESSSKDSKRCARTPFGRAQTMFAGTPMDIEMASPSPMAIASLSLSPRRNGSTRAPTTHVGNIFAAANSANPRWDHREAAGTDSEDEEMASSPTRQIKSLKNPFTSKDRPVLLSQKTCPAKAKSTGFVSKAVGAPPVPGRARSPARTGSKIPAAGTAAAAEGPSGTGNTSRKTSLRKESHGAEPLSKVAVKNNIRGRTLVELQQARASGRPGSLTTGENVSPKRAPMRERAPGERRASGGTDTVAIWDPERDEMPSPFLVRQRRQAKS